MSKKVKRTFVFRFATCSWTSVTFGGLSGVAFITPERRPHLMTLRPWRWGMLVLGSKYRDMWIIPHTMTLISLVSCLKIHNILLNGELCYKVCYKLHTLSHALNYQRNPEISCYFHGIQTVFLSFINKLLKKSSSIYLLETP